MALGWRQLCLSLWLLVVICMADTSLTSLKVKSCSVIRNLTAYPYFWEGRFLARAETLQRPPRLLGWFSCQLPYNACHCPCKIFLWSVRSNSLKWVFNLKNKYCALCAWNLNPQFNIWLILRSSLNKWICEMWWYKPYVKSSPFSNSEWS